MFGDWLRDAFVVACALGVFVFIWSAASLVMEHRDQREVENRLTGDEPALMRRSPDGRFREVEIDRNDPPD